MPRMGRDALSRPSPLLRISDVAMRFGGVVALAGVSFDVGYGQICGLIGPNGSGKTTLFNCISGFYRFTDGDILFEGRSLKRLGRHWRVDMRWRPNSRSDPRTRWSHGEAVDTADAGEQRGLAEPVGPMAPQAITYEPTT